MTNEESIQDIKIHTTTGKIKAYANKYVNTVIPVTFSPHGPYHPLLCINQPLSLHLVTLQLHVVEGIETQFYLDIKANTLNFGVDSIGHRLDWERKWYIIPDQEATSNHAWHKSSKHKSTLSYCLVLSPSRAKMTISMRRRLPDGTTVIPRQALKHQ